MISRVANETLNGGAGNDTIVGQKGDSLDGGEGTDTVTLDLSSVTDNLTLTFDVSPTTTNNLQGLFGTEVKNFENFTTLTLGDGNDSLTLLNNALINGGTVFGDHGTDTLIIDYTNQTGLTSGIQNTSNSSQIRDRSNNSVILTYSSLENFNITGTQFDDSLQGWSRNDTLGGGDGNDYLDGNGGDDSISGGAGDDYLMGDSGNDTLEGGTGDDTIIGEIGETLDGGEGIDALDLDLSSVTEDLTVVLDFNITNNLQGISNTQVTNFEAVKNLETGSGNDIITASSVVTGARIDGNAGNDILTVDFTNATHPNLGVNDLGIDNTSNSFTNRILTRYSVSGITTLLSYSNIEQFNITGTQFDDRLRGFSNDDTLVGGQGNDIIFGQLGDSLDGGEGTDTLQELDFSSSTENITLNLDFSTSNNLQGEGINGTVVKNFEQINNIDTGSGDDVINLASSVLLQTNARINGNAGTDILAVDFTNATHPNLGVNGLGIDNTSNSFTNRILTRYSVSGITTLLSYSNIEQFNITGTQYNDRLRGFSNDDTLVGGQGNDIIFGQIGDSLDGGEGTDTLDLDLSSSTENITLNLDFSTSNNLQGEGFSGTQIKNFEQVDDIETGSGDDVINLASSVLLQTNARINGNAGTDILAVDFTNATHPNLGINGLGIDNTSNTFTNRILTRYSSSGITTLLSYSNIEQFNITGTQYNDMLQGFANDDTLVGGQGNDNLRGQDGNDQISGVDATNTTPGLNEIDTLSGGNGNDRFILGDAANSYYDDKDTTTDGTLDYAYITDFNPNEDTIQLHSSKSNYILSNTTLNDILGTGIYLNKPSTEPNELIAFLAGVTDLDIHSNAFTIAQDEIAFSETQFRILEDGNPVIPVTLIRSGAVQSETSVTINLNNGTATTPTDFNNTPITVNFAAGETSKTVDIPIIDDTIFELEEDILLTLSNPTNGTTLGLQNTANLTIVDNEIPNPGIISFNRADYSINENGNPIVTVTLNRIEGSDGNVSVKVNLTDGTATANEDYNNSPIIVNFANQETTKTVTIPILDDTIFEPNETINLTLSDPTNDATIGEQNTATLTIIEDDEPGVLSFSRSNFSVNEDGTNVITVRINRTNGTDGEVAVTLNLNDGTANATEDYDNTPITVNFGHGESSKNISIPLNNDTIYELDETINLSLSNPTNGATLGTQTTATLTIIDDDANPGTLEFSDSNFTINEDGTTTQEVTIIRTNGSDGDVSATIYLTPGTATPNTDYNNNSIRVDFANGETSKTVTIPIIDDPELEADETINLTLNNPSNGAIIGTENTATLTIIDNDIARPGTVNFNRSQYSINEDGTPIHTITLLRTSGDDGEITVTVNLTDGTATANEDYNNSSIPITFADQETSKTITVPIINDSEFEPTENLTLSLSNATNGATVGTNNTATLNIINDDVPIPGTFAFSQSNFSINEDGTPVVAVTIIRTEGSDGNVSATINLIGDTATNPEDYTTNSITVNFADEELSKVVTIPLVNDNEYELDETLNLTIDSVSNGATIGTQNTATLTIINDDPIQPGTVNFNRSQYSINEDGTTIHTITLLRTNGDDGEITVTVNLTDGTATANEDYNNSSIPVTFADQETSKTITVPIVNDSEFEPTENLTLSLSNATNGATVGTQNTATLNIINDDVPIPGTFAFSQSNFSINEDGTPVVAVTIIRTEGSDGNVSATINLTADTATNPEDYTTNSITVNFADGELSKVVTIPLVNDNEYELDETLNLTLNTVSNGATIGTQNTATLTIINDDPIKPGTVNFNQSQYSINEDGTPVSIITLLRTGGNDGEITVTVNLNDGTATALNDYNNSPILVTFGDGETNKTLTVPIVNDTQYEDTETINLSLTNATNGAAIGTNSTATVRIIDNDAVPGIIEFNNTDYTVNEDGTVVAAITLIRIGGSDGNVSIRVTPSNGTAIAGDDYINNNSITVNFGDGETSKTVNITLINDVAVEDNETINLTLSNPIGGATIGTQNTATLTVIDDDFQAALTLDISENSVSENEGTVTATITRNTSTDIPLEVSLVSSDNSELVTPQTVTIPVGETSVTVTLTVVDDTLIDTTQNVQLIATAPEFISAIDDISILNNDTVNLTLTIDSPSSQGGLGGITENGGITTATITRDGVIDQPLTVQITGDNGIILPNNITIAANQNSATFEVEAINNTEVNGDQTVNITATPLYQGTNVAIADKTVTATINIIDDESPSLTLESDRSLISETGSATVTITRNTDTTEALTVNLTSSDTSEATIPNAVTIAAGETSTTAIVTGVSDGVSDGSQPVTITAIATGLNGSQTTLEVSDIEVPDLVITELGVNSPEYTDQTSQFSYKVANLGLQNLSGTWTDRVYLSTDNKLDENDELLTEFDITANIQVGQFYERNVSYFNPRLPGQYYLIATTDAEIVDENGQLTDQVNEGTGLGESNNTTITPFTVLPAYSAEVSTDVNIAVTGETIFFEGTARSNQDNSPIPFEFVTIEVEKDGFTRKFNSFTDIDGNFTYNFTPLQGEAGDYNIRAYFPDNVGEDVGYEDSFSVLGATFNTSNVNHDIIADTPFTASVTLENLTDTALTGFTYDVSSLPNNWDVTVNLPSDLAGNGSNTIGYTITAPNDSVITQDSFNINLTSAEGVTASLPVFVDLERQVPRLVADTDTVTRGMLRGEQTFVEIELTNEGGATANDIQVLLPDAPWLSLATADTIESLAPGESTNVTLALTPSDDLRLTEYQGNIIFDAAGNDGDFGLDFNFRAVSEAVGTLDIKITDEFYYFTEGKPLVENASVVLRDAITREIVFSSEDVDEQLILNDLVEGHYILEVEADKHNSYQELVEIQAGESSEIEAFLPRRGVEYFWDVEEVEIDDSYNINIETVFETNVPYPVVTIDPPSIDLGELTEVGQVKILDMTLENHGLVEAIDLQLGFSEHPYYKITPLIDTLDVLAAKSSITVPVKLERIADDNTIGQSQISTSLNSSEIVPSNNNVLNVPCFMGAFFNYGYICGLVKRNNLTNVPIINVEGDCASLAQVLLYLGAAYNLFGLARAIASKGLTRLLGILIPNLGNIPLGEPEITRTTKTITTTTTPNFTGSGCDLVAELENNLSRDIPDELMPEFSALLEEINSQIDENSEGICAQVTIKIEQEAVMSRSAFEGSFIIDNANDLPLENFSLALEIKDEQGNIVNDLFGINEPTLSGISSLDGSGIIQENSSGSAEFIFIPTGEAAPTEATSYSIGGTLSYVEDGQTIVRDLNPATITVLPQAELTLDYFHQRNVYGDDPFTDATEVAEPFSLAVLVKNNGFGDARNLSITSAQPEIIENEKGLLVDFDIIGSSVNGENLNPSLTVEFGDIEAGETAIGEWLLKSSLQGKFIEYEATFEHLNDLGDTELSLIKEVNIHELIQTVQADDDGLSDFLVNGEFDTNFYPDILYFSDGTTAPVTAIDNVTLDAPVTIFDLEAEITTTATAGWTYIILDDPADGQFKIDKIIRDDGTGIKPENIWRTDRTFPATGRPTYENKLHFLDFDATATYTIIYDSNDNAPPKVREILDVDPNPHDIPVDSLTVVFTEAIRANTFDYQDITLTLDDGTNLITNAVSISRIDPITFRINNLTEITGNIGQYKLSIDATGIQDLAGNMGAGSITENWLFTGDRPTVESVDGFTNNLLTTAVENLTITFTEVIQTDSFTYEDITLTRNEGGNLVNDSIVITQIGDRTFEVSNLTQFTNVEGDYELLVTANDIQDIDNNNGIGGKGFTWVLDNTAPILIDIDDVTSPRNTPISSIEVTINQAIDPERFTYQDITLTLDGGTNLITSDVEIEKRNETTYIIKGLTFLQETEGEYTLTVKGSGIEDNAGNPTTNNIATTWKLDQTDPLLASNIQVSATTPPLSEGGISTLSEGGLGAIATLNQYGQYRVNSQNITISGQLPEENLRVYLTDATTGENLAQASVTGSTFTGDIELSGVGPRTIELTIVDQAGNSSTGSIDIFADVTEPVLLNFLNIPTTPTQDPINSIDVQFSEPIDLSTFDKNDLTLLRDGVVITLPETVTITLVSDNTYSINGLGDVTNTPGNYTIQVDTTTLSDNAGNPGSELENAIFTIATPPDPGVTITETAGNTIVTEGGNSDTYSIVLDTQPTDTVTINLTVGSGITTDITSITFDNTNWNTPQTITITADNDTIPEGDHNATINHTITSTDTNYNILNLPEITVNINDDDAEIKGQVWNDVNGDGVKDATEEGLSGWTVYLDENNDGELNNGEISLTTDENGNYHFTNLRPDIYTVAQVVQEGWQQTSPLVDITTTAANIPLSIPTHTSYPLPITETATETTPVVTTDNSQAIVNFNTTQYIVNEDGTAISEIIVTRSGNLNGEVSATLLFSDGTAEGCGCSASSVRNDFNNRSLTVTFKENETIKVIPVENAIFNNPNAIRIRNDERVEGNEYFTIQLTNPSDGTTIGQKNSATVTIIDDETEILNNTTTIQNNNNGNNLINLDEFWNDPRFSNIKGQEFATVIIDTGADLDHSFFGPDNDGDGIADRIVYQYDFADDDNDASDVNNHGSHVTSIIASSDDTYTGIASETDIIVLKVFGDDGSGTFADLEAALQWVNENANTYNIASVNLSLGDSQNWTTEVSRYGIGDELAAIASQNIVVAAAAGNAFYTFNSEPGLSYPAIDPNVVSVGAVWADDFGSRSFNSGAVDYSTDADRIASFSQRHSLLDVFAPGVLITGANANGGTISMGGTSQATPYITGMATVAQQIAQLYLGRELTASEFNALLDTTSDFINDGDNEDDNVVNTGLDYPRINVLALAEAIITLDSNSSFTPPTDTNNEDDNTPIIQAGTLTHTVALQAGDIVDNLDFGNQLLVDEIQREIVTVENINLGEADTITLDHNLQTITLDQTYINPVIFAPSVSFNGGQPTTPRISNVTSNSFDIYLQEPSNEDGIHALETLSYFVFEAGTYQLSDGTLLEIGTLNTGATANLNNGGVTPWQTVDFDIDFADTPVIFSQVQSDNETDLVRTRQQNATANGFEVVMEEDEVKARNGETHLNETIGYVAISGGVGTSNGVTFLADSTDNSVTHEFSSISFGGEFSNTPHFLANVATYDGADSSGIRFRDLTVNNVQVALQEDTTFDGETFHTTEVVNYLAFQGDNALQGTVYDPLTGNKAIIGTDADEYILGLPEDDTRTGKGGSDIFVLEPNQGTDTITDFELGVDLIGLGDNLTFGSLTLTDTGNDTSVMFNSQELAIIKGVQSSDLISNNFVEAIRVKL